MKPTKEIKDSVAYRYAEDVRSGKIVTSNWVRLAVDRFFRQIKDAEKNGHRLNHSAAMMVIDFFPTFLVHTAGPMAGQPFELSPYQQFTYYNVFGWEVKNPNGQWVRLFKTVYEKVARKNGKTAGLAGLGLFGMSFDGEGGSQVYVGATKEKQAKITWEQARDFVDMSPGLRAIGFQNYQTEIRFQRPGLSRSVFRYLGGDSKTQDGLNPSIAIIDEYHAHPTDGVREVLESAMGARQQPLLWIITTAGFKSGGVQMAYEKVCKEILEGSKDDPETFIMIHELDEGDDWNDSTTWIKANPNLGVSLSMDFLVHQYNKAKNQPSKARNFKIKHLNLQADGLESFIPLNMWDACVVKEIPSGVFLDHGCCLGVDLSATTDLTAAVLVSNEDSEGIRYMIPWLFCPQDTIDQRSKEDGVPYRAWAKAGYLTPTKGGTVDYEFIREHIFQRRDKYGINKILLDRYHAPEMATKLNRMGFDAQYINQSWSAMAYPTKQFEALIINRRIRFLENPLMRWMLSNCVTVHDSNDNYKVHKGKSQDSGGKRIDGIVAAIMAVAGTLDVDDQKNQSKYLKDPESIWM